MSRTYLITGTLTLENVQFEVYANGPREAKHAVHLHQWHDRCEDEATVKKVVIKSIRVIGK